MTICQSTRLALGLSAFMLTTLMVYGYSFRSSTRVPPSFLCGSTHGGSGSCSASARFHGPSADVRAAVGWRRGE